MILAHTIIGVTPVIDSEFSLYWFIGSIIPDVDHLFVLYKHRIFSWNKFRDVLKFEDKYGIHFKTKYLHSIFGAVLTSIPILFISFHGAFLYFIAYAIHLFLDLPDIDEKQYFYPLKKKLRGFLPIFSRTEVVFTLFLIVFFIYQISNILQPSYTQ